MAAHIRIIMFSIVGAVFLILGLATVLSWPSILGSIVSGKTTLSNHSGSYAEWANSTMPMRLEVYFFNWTNPHLNSNGSLAETPNLVQLGPYVFREHREKVILGWNDENQTVTYLENRTWFFEPWLSHGNLSDIVTTIDVPAVTTAYALRNASDIWTGLANQMFKAFSIKLTVSKTVEELMFQGYSNPIMDFARMIPKKYLPFPMPFDKFGWFYTRNGSATYDGTFNMNTGAKNMKIQGKLEEWNYENQTNFYPSDCGAVNGSAGELFGGGRDRSFISFYSPDICRPVFLNYAKDVSTSGISAYRFVGDPKMFSNKTSVPDNWCYYKDGPTNHTQADGVLDISSCKWGAPLFVSFPHFYQADPSYRTPVIGMNPDPNLHQMLLDVEPLTGVPIHASAGLQISVLIQPVHAFSFLRNIPKIYFPSIWFREIADVDGGTENQLAGLSSLARTPVIVGYVVLSIGVTVLLVIGVILVAQRCRKNDEDEDYLINPSTTTNDTD